MAIDYANRNKKVLDDFVSYCNANPYLRFWQALRNWSGYGFILAADLETGEGMREIDTFHWEGKDH